jgi:hypothetical protein
VKRLSSEDTAHAILIEFNPDERTLDQDSLGGPPEAAESYVLRNTAFVAAMRLQVAGLELFVHRDPTGDAPVAGRSVPMIAAIEALITDLTTLAPGDQCQYDPDEGAVLRFEREGARVHLSSLLFSDTTITIYHAAFLKAAHMLEEQVRLFLVESIPTLAQHPDLGAWFRGESSFPND